MLELAEGRNLEKSGQWDKAREVYLQVKRKYPQRPEVYHRLGVVADRQRRHDEAQRMYAQAIRLSPIDAELFNDLGYCFYLQGQLEKAESALHKAVELESDNPRFRNNLGMVLGQRQRYQEALAEFSAAGSEADAFYNLAFVYASQDKTERAMACFQHALSLNPAHEKAREALASFQQFDQRDHRQLALDGQSDPDGQMDLDYGTGGADYVPYVERGETEVVARLADDPASAGSEVRTAGHEALPGSHRQAGRVGYKRMPSLLRHGAAAGEERFGDTFGIADP